MTPVLPVDMANVFSLMVLLRSSFSLISKEFATKVILTTDTS